MTPSTTPLTWVTPSLALNFSGVKVPPSVPPSAVLPVIVDFILPAAFLATLLAAETPWSEPDAVAADDAPDHEHHAQRERGRDQPSGVRTVLFPRFMAVLPPSGPKASDCGDCREAGPERVTTHDCLVVRRMTRRLRDGRARSRRAVAPARPASVGGRVRVIWTGGTVMFGRVAVSTSAAPPVGRVSV